MGLKNINRISFIKDIAEDMDLPYSTVRAVIDEVFSISDDYLKAPHTFKKPALYLKNFGTFEPVQRRVMAKAYKAKEEKDEWLEFKDLVINYYTSKKHKKNKNELSNEEERTSD